MTRRRLSIDPTPRGFGFAGLLGVSKPSEIKTMTPPMWEALLRLVCGEPFASIPLGTLRALDRRGLLINIHRGRGPSSLGYTVAAAYQAGRYSMNEQGDQGGFKS